MEVMEEPYKDKKKKAECTSIEDYETNSKNK